MINIVHVVSAAVVAYVLGAFTPAVGRKIKAAIVAYAKKVEAKAAAEIKKV